MNTSLKDLEPQRPSLYRLAADGRSLDFLFSPCPACSRLTFPANAPGCTHCGAGLDGAEPVVLAGGGMLMEYATVHVALAPGMEAGAVVGDIEIAPGIFMEGVLGVSTENELLPGMSMRAIAVPLATTAQFACRFVPAETLYHLEVGA